MRVTMVLLICAALAACARVNETHLPDGKKGYTIICNEMADCLREAGNICKERGYTVIDDRSDTRASSTLTAQPGYLAGGTIPYQRSSLLISCKG